MSFANKSMGARFFANMAFAIATFAACSLLYVPVLRAEITADSLSPAVQPRAAVLNTATDTLASSERTSPLDATQPLFDRLAQAQEEAAPPTPQTPATAPAAVPAPAASSNPIAAATADVGVHVNSMLWGLLGCATGLIGILIAYLVPPTPPATSLVGKDPGYIATYTSTYQDVGKKAQGKAAIIGCLIGNVVGGAVWLIYTAAVTATLY